MVEEYESVVLSRSHVSVILRVVGSSRFDLVLANDVGALPVSFAVARGNCPVVLDAYEYAPDEDDAESVTARINRKQKMWLCVNYLRQVAAMMTVSQPIAEKYSMKFHLPLPVVVLNAVPFQVLNPKTIAPGQIKLIYHGVAGRARGVEILIDTMKLMSPRFHLTLILIIDANQKNKLKNRINHIRNLALVDPVPTSSIPQIVNDFDLAVYLMQPVTFNERPALPNKFFENAQGRVGQVITPTSEMQHLVNEYNLGTVSRGFDAISFAETLESPDSEMCFAFKLAADKSARALSWETYAPRIHQVIDEVL